jgi:hypothetical protein
MTEAVTLTEAPAAPQGLAARIVGVLFSPGVTYADVAARPRVLGVLAFVTLVSALVWFVFLSTPVGQDALFNQQMDFIEGFGIELPEQAYDQMEQGLRWAPYSTAASQIVMLPVMALVIAGLIMAVFNAVMGGSATFKQVYAIVAHSGVVLALHTLFMAPLNYLRESMSSPSTLRAFTPFLDESSFPGQFLGLVDLFHVWWIVSLSIGIGVLYRRRTAPIAISALSVYGALMLILAAVFTRFSGGQ